MVCRNAIDVGSSFGLDIRQGPGGTVIGIVGNDSTGIFKGKVAVGGISARTSDSAHGTGTVEVWYKDPSTGDYVDSGETEDVDYISSTIGGLSAGVWVNCAYRDDGGAEIISVDCAN